EHKMGIHASPTCVMSFGETEGAVGFLIGEEQAGMRYMFTMMNSARVGVGIEGLAIGERAYQRARQFASERRQGRVQGAAATESVPIISHPDVRRMLMTIKAYNEAMRALLYTNAEAFDREKFSETAEERELAAERVALLTPITKAWSTDLGVELASLGIQIHGGMGFVEETGAAQYLRDARIAPIYEGTNGIQSIDLVTRKITMRQGDVVNELLDEVADTASSASGGYAEMGEHLDRALASLREATTHLLKVMPSDPDQALAGATPYLKMFGTVLGGWFHLRSAIAASSLLDAGDGDDSFLRGRIGLARFYCGQLLPQVEGLLPSVLAPASDLALENLA
ncbi:MAG: acyl-CoA dehydrogenase, partial [Acidimicrobiia bacterium]